MIPQYNAYSTSGAPPFLFNATYDLAQSNEANLYNNISSEYCYLYGRDTVFIPKEVGMTEEVFGEFLAARFDKGFPLRVFVEEMEAWGGGGDIYSKFGIQVTDECTIYLNKTSFNQATSGVYPKQGDLFYIVTSQKLFEIQHIEDETAPGFYHFGNRTWYRVNCKLFSYNHEVINQSISAGIPAAIQALDALLDDTENSLPVTLEDKENINYNSKVEALADIFIDESENDPLTS